MRLGRTLWLGAALAFTSGACGGGGQAVDDTAYAEATPDFEGLSLQINSDEAAREGAALFDEVYGVHRDALEGEGPEFLVAARQHLKPLNQTLKEFITTIAGLVNEAAPRMEPGDVRVFGPKDRAGATFRLKMRRLADRRFSWRLEARPLGSTDEAAWRVVAAGAMARGETPHRGRGHIGIHLDNLRAVAPSTSGQGRLMASFAHVEQHKSLAYRLLAFTPDPAVYEPMTGAFVGHRLMPSKATRIRLMGKHHFAASPTDAKEDVLARVRFVPGVGGRADVHAVGGDIPEGQFYLGTACWDAVEQEQFKRLMRCTRGQPLTTCEPVGPQVGTREACPADLRQPDEAPSGSANDTTPEPGSPEDPGIPPADVLTDF